MNTTEGAEAIVNHASMHGFGDHMTQYKIRDWLVSRQRYWGTPIPIMYCEKCGVRRAIFSTVFGLLTLLPQVIPVPEDQLPVELPSSVHLSGRGPSPLAQADDWLRASCGKYVGCNVFMNQIT